MVDLAGYKRAIDQAYCCDEQSLIQAQVEQLTEKLNAANFNIQTVADEAESIIHDARQHSNPHPLNELLQTYDLSQPEGLQLMALAEALLRTQDASSAKALILDKISGGQWQDAKAKTRWNKASSALLSFASHTLKHNGEALHDRISQLALPVAHRVLRRVVKSIASQFVFAEDIQKAIEEIKFHLCANECFSLDMLGEAAITHQDAERFFKNYQFALEQLAKSSIAESKTSKTAKIAATSLSVKLSALYPRYEISHREEAISVIAERLLALCCIAKEHDIAITVDAEESDRLMLSLEIFERVYLDEKLNSYEGLGFAVQAYNKQALHVLQYLQTLADHADKTLPVRLVKGAYWDSEIKNAQIQGLANYPVFTDKTHTDIYYLACAHYMLESANNLYPQFATHNAVTIAHILAVAKADNGFEFQRLHGMGESVYQQVYKKYPNSRCRIYGPVGEYAELLAYLVRRILENGANNAFVRQFATDAITDSELSIHPLVLIADQLHADRPSIVSPGKILPDRKKARGLHWASKSELNKFLEKIDSSRKNLREAAIPLVGFECQIEPPKAVYNPYTARQMGVYYPLNPAELPKALLAAKKAWPSWRKTSACERAKILEDFADKLEQERERFIALLVDEAGKTIEDALEEVREAIDFARYYAANARTLFSSEQILPGPTGEQNTLSWRPRGVVLCISPWNFPLAIFTGQVLAALVAGNCVLAKPASQTPLVAYHVVKLLQSLGVKSGVLQYLPVAGSAIDRQFLQASELSGVAFTGSNSTANALNRHLAERPTGFIPFIAETGGQNAMIVEATALPEQVVRDVVRSAFYSAGQRCSALRVLYIQDSIFNQVIELLAEALYTLKLGNPSLLATDIGPIIDSDAKKVLQTYIDKKIAAGRVYAKAKLPEACASSFIAPHIIGVESILNVDQEYFGPILHVARFSFEQVESVIDDINQCGYGLTFGIHSRNQTFTNRVCEQVAVGNIYVNRNITGAVVGVQPFGGQGLSGTGFKAGGPHYLLRFATEVSISNNTAAIGGNTQLLTGGK